jgi:hypothetical protein
MVPIPADPQRVLEDESAGKAVSKESLFNRQMPAGEALSVSLLAVGPGWILCAKISKDTELIDD